MDDSIKGIVDAHVLHCPYSKTRIKSIVRKPKIFTLNDCKFSDALEKPSETNKFITWSEFAAQLAPSVKPLILFSNTIKEFCMLSICDQVTCLKFSLFEIWLVQISRLISTENGTITFFDGYCMSKTQLELMYDDEFVDKILNFCDFLNDLQLSDAVIALYSIVILHNPDRKNLQHSGVIKEIQKEYLKQLKYQLVNQEEKIEIFEILVSLLPELYSFGEKHNQCLKCIWNESSQTDVPYFLSEVFDYALNEDDIN